MARNLVDRFRSVGGRDLPHLAFASIFAASDVNAQQIKIVALGGSSTTGRECRGTEAYPAKLQAALRAKGIDASVTNAGISGDTSAGGLARVDSVAPAGTHVVIVELGINDAGKGIDLETTVENVKTIVKRVRSRGAQVLVIGFRGGSGAIGEKSPLLRAGDSWRSTSRAMNGTSIAWPRPAKGDEGVSLTSTAPATTRSLRSWCRT